MRRAGWLGTDFGPPAACSRRGAAAASGAGQPVRGLEPQAAALGIARSIRGPSGAIEAAARSLRSIAQAGRKLAPTDAYPRAMRDALEDVATIGLEVSARRGPAAASGLTHADAVRLAEIIAGPDDAWTLLGLLKARAA